MSGAQNAESGTAFLDGAIAGTVLAIAALQLLLAIIWTGAAYVPKLSLLGAKALFAVVVTLVGEAVTVDYGDYFWATSGDHRYWLDAHPEIGWAGFVCLIALPLGLGITARWMTRRRLKTSPKEAMRKAQNVHLAALWVSGIVTTALMAISVPIDEASSAGAAGGFDPWMAMVVMAFVGGSEFMFVWGLPYGD